MRRFSLIGVLFFLCFTVKSQKWYEHSMKAAIDMIDTGNVDKTFQRVDQLLNRILVSKSQDWAPNYYKSLLYLKWASIDYQNGFYEESLRKVQQARCIQSMQVKDSNVLVQINILNHWQQYILYKKFNYRLSQNLIQSIQETHYSCTFKNMNYIMSDLGISCDETYIVDPIPVFYPQWNVDLLKGFLGD